MCPPFAVCLTPVAISKWRVCSACLCGFSLLSTGCCIARNVDAFCCPGSCFVTVSSFGRLPENHLGNPGTSYHGHLEENMFPYMALGIRRRKPTSFLCWSKFGGTGLKELNINLISSIKSPAKTPEMQSVNEGRMWLSVNVLTPSCEVMSYRQLASDLLPTQRNSRVR